MDAPPVRYAHTSDGYSIAFTVAGSGPPVLFVPALMHHVEHYWHPGSTLAGLFERLCRRYTFIDFDPRGAGMSRRGIGEDAAIDDFRLDIEAVAGHLGMERFVLFSHAATGICIDFAVRDPERVAGLILQNPRLNGKEGPLNLMESLAQQDFEMFLDACARMMAGGSPSVAKDIMRQATSRDDFLSVARVFHTYDIEAIASQVRVPALLLAARATAWSFGTEAGAKEVAALIPGARVALFDDATGGLSATGGQTPAAMDAIETFIAELDFTPAEPSRLEAGALSAREVEVLRLIAQGRSNAQIAEALVISPNTVGRHVSNIFDKTGAANRAEATAYALRNGLA